MVRLSDFDYDLPTESIAQRPLSDRAASKLLHLDPTTGEIWDRAFGEAVGLLESGDTLVLNNTRVNPWRLRARKASGGAVEVLLVKSLDEGRFEAMLRPGKRLHPGTILAIGEDLICEVMTKDEGAVQIVRMRSLQNEDVDAVIARHGTVPLPPYILETPADMERYQTVFAEPAGSAAAPTAALHFTHELLDKLKLRGVNIVFLTLHVSIDTFRPVISDDPAEHKMHGEWCEISTTAAAQINSTTGRVIAVGTTTVRTLESLAIGPKMVRAGRLNTQIFITPGFEFQIVDGMFTNFHMSRTTMLLMIGAMAGREYISAAYGHAVANGYRFLSFGDSMLILAHNSRQNA